MKSIYKTPDQPATVVPRLALRPRVAAEQLSMSEKGLFNASFPRGTIPCVKVGASVLYFRHQLERWADEQLAAQQAEAAQLPAAECEVER